MRRLSPFLRTLLDAGGPFTGANKAQSRITVEPGWSLNLQSGRCGNWPPNKLPVRWWQRGDNSQVELEVPNIKSVTIDRTIDQDAATMSVQIYNTLLDPATSVTLAGEMGQPGYFTFTRGQARESKSRWGQSPNSWANVLEPNALLRVYQGYGGANLTIPQAVAAGNIMLVGTFLVDTVTVMSGGILQMDCRDMMKLLIDQQLYPPLVPQDNYPLYYMRWTTQIVPGYVSNAGGWVNKRCVFIKSGNDVWFGQNGSDVGHRPTDAFDNNPDTYWMSVGNANPGLPFAVEFIEADCQEDINGVFLYPWAGNYQCFISVFENGGYVGAQNIAYNPAGIGRYTGNYAANVNYTVQFGVPWEQPQWVPLDRRYHAQGVRFTFTNLQWSPWGPYRYRAGVRELGLGDNGGGISIGPHPITVPGNYNDYTDIIKDILLWSGFWRYDANEATSDRSPSVYGNLEYSGAPGTNAPVDQAVLGTDIFDKKAPIDAIKLIRDILGFVFRCDGAGAIRWETPNWWKTGNFYEDGSPTSFIPLLDERLNVSEFTAAASDNPLRSEIIVTVNDPAVVPPDGTPTSRFQPPNVNLLRGMVKPVMLGALVGTNQRDTDLLAQLTAMQIWFAQRQGQVHCVFRPDIDIDTQVWIHERVTGEAYIHYVRGVHTEHDLDSGKHMMTLTTHWLGDTAQWAITSGPLPAQTYQQNIMTLGQSVVNLATGIASQKTSGFRSGVANIGVTAADQPAVKTQTVTDTFPGPGLAPAWSGSSPSITVSGNQAIIPVTKPQSNLTANGPYSLVSSYVYAKIGFPGAGNGSRQMGIDIVDAAANKIQMFIDGSNLKFNLRQNNIDNVSQIAYSSTSHAWFKIVEANGNITWQTSPDGLTWTTRRVSTYILNPSLVSVVVWAGYYGTETPANGTVANFNIGGS